MPTAPRSACYPGRLAALLIAALAPLGVAVAFSAPANAGYLIEAAPQIASADKACISTATLYDGSLGGTPDTQGMSYLTLAVSATQIFSGGVTLLDTLPRRGDFAGYTANAARVPSLDRTSGYTLTLGVQMVSEAHANNNRAGFSLIALSSDTRGIELGFWKDQVWAQEDGSAEPPAGTLFTHAESGPIDTTTGVISYTLAVQGDGYGLAADGVPILSGRLRDYSAFVGAIDPYETPHFIFIGDDSSSAGATTRIAALSVAAVVPCSQTHIYLPLVHGSGTYSLLPRAKSHLSQPLRKSRELRGSYGFTFSYGGCAGKYRLCEILGCARQRAHAALQRLDLDEPRHLPDDHDGGVRPGTCAG
jgi:hypothetical protein